MAGTREQKEARLQLFVSHYLAKGDTVAAAEAAGYKGTKGRRGTLRVRGSRLLTEANARGLIEKKREEVQTAADESLQGAVSKLWRQAKGLEPAEWETIKVEGIQAETSKQKYKPLAALDCLLTYYEREKDAPTVNHSALVALPDTLVRQVYRALMEGSAGVVDAEKT